MPVYEHILTETHGRVGLVRLNRPKALNALSSPLLLELFAALKEFDKNSDIGAVVITGSDRAFAAGADIKEMFDLSAVEMQEQDFISIFDQIKRIEKPVIGAVSGWCIGGGSELALSCDMIIASETAKFGQPEINLGVIPGAGGTQRLTRVVGKAIAMEMVLNNRTITAQEAMSFGLVNRVCPVENYLEEALQLAADIADRAPLAVKAGKEMVNHAYESTLADGLQYERQQFYALFSTQDQKEGMQAFLEKRKPKWSGV